MGDNEVKKQDTRKLAFLSNRNTIVQIKLKNYVLSLISYFERKISS